jgi:hypothetical protein
MLEMAFSNSSSPRASSGVSVQGCVVLTSLAAYLTIFTMSPFENLAACYITRGHDGANEIVWLIVLLQLQSICITDKGFSVSFSRPRRPVTEYICAQRLDIRVRSAAAPNKRSLGATNGLPQTVVAFQFNVGPAAAAPLFAFSLASDLLSGSDFFYVVLFAFVCVPLCVAAKLQRHTWKHGDGK